MARNVHHLISAYPESVAKMECSIVTLTVAESVDDDVDHSCKFGLTEVLVATLAWACRCDPPFSQVTANDRRTELVLEILCALYALGVGGGQSMTSNETMAWIGILLCDLLRYPSADERLYQIKLAVISLLLNSPAEYSDYLLNNKGIDPLVDILDYQTSLVVVERTENSAEDAAAVVPVLLTLMRLVQSNKLVLKVVKDAVFPPDSEVEFEEKAMFKMGKGRSEGKINAKNMEPLDAPNGTLRWRLIRLMTWTESNVKRAACELLWALSDGNSTQFVLRTGFGNAIHYLGIRGCVNLPVGVDI